MLISADCRSQTDYFKHHIVYPRGGQTVDRDTIYIPYVPEYGQG